MKRLTLPDGAHVTAPSVSRATRAHDRAPGFIGMELHDDRVGQGAVRRKAADLPDAEPRAPAARPLTRYFDPNKTVLLFAWTNVRNITLEESRRMLDGGAFWLPLANDPYDKTASGDKTVEVRNPSPIVRKIHAGCVGVLARAYRMPRLAVTCEARLQFSNLEQAKRDAGRLLERARLPREVAS